MLNTASPRCRVPKFRKGDRVRINGKYAEWSGTLDEVGRRGTIEGECHSTPLLWRVVLDDLKTPQIMHHSFLTRIKEE